MRETICDTDQEAKEEAAQWLQRPVQEVDWEASESDTLIRATNGVMDVEIRRFPVQRPDLPIHRRGPT